MMQFVISIAMFISSLMGTDFENDWACWESFIPSDNFQYVCEYVNEDDHYGITIGSKFSDGKVMMMVQGN